jgi:hypothetical protein
MAHEALNSLRLAVLLSRSMRDLTERGEIRELVVQMHERDILLRKVFTLLESLKSRGQGANGGTVAWSEVLSVIREFDSENALLIEGLKTQRRAVVRNIAEAESHRRLSAYVA